MKFIEKTCLTLFSIIILTLSLVLSLMLFNWIDISNAYYLLKFLILTPLATNISLVVVIVLMLLSLKCIFFASYNKDKNERTEGILLENESGKLLISIETIENLVKGVISGFENVKSTNCKVKLDKQINNVIIDLNLVVSSDTIIKDVSTNIQTRVKEVIKIACEFLDKKDLADKIRKIRKEASKSIEIIE